MHGLYKGCFPEVTITGSSRHTQMKASHKPAAQLRGRIVPLALPCALLRGSLAAGTPPIHTQCVSRQELGPKLREMEKGDTAVAMILGWGVRFSLFSQPIKR